MLVITKHIDNYSKSYVFGEDWKHNNKIYRTSFKTFMERLFVPVWMADKPHRIRNISEVATAIQSKFDRRTMDLLGIFSRHSVKVIENDYLKWTKLSRNRKCFDRYICTWEDSTFTKCSLEPEDITYVWDNIDSTYLIDNVINGPSKVTLSDFNDEFKMSVTSRVTINEQSILPSCNCGKQIILQRFKESDTSTKRFYDYCNECNILFDITRNMSNIKKVEHLLKEPEVRNIKNKKNEILIVRASDNAHYHLPSMRGKTRKIYVGMDVSINGMSICTYEINNGIIDRIVFDYWHKDVVRLGNVEYFNIEINR